MRVCVWGGGGVGVWVWSVLVRLWVWVWVSVWACGFPSFYLSRKLFPLTVSYCRLTLYPNETVSPAVMNCTLKSFMWRAAEWDTNGHCHVYFTFFVRPWIRHLKMPDKFQQHSGWTRKRKHLKTFNPAIKIWVFNTSVRVRADILL